MAVLEVYSPKTKEVYLDRKGKRIYEYDLLKCFHFIGARNKKHYMYKYVTVKDGHLYALHLDGTNNGYFLKSEARAQQGTTLDRIEVLQSPIRLKFELGILREPTA